MTKFETVGINLQYEAKDKEQAIKRFSRSCECCCNRGLHIRCDRCGIEVVNKLVVASFENAERKEG